MELNPTVSILSAKLISRNLTRVPRFAMKLSRKLGFANIFFPGVILTVGLLLTLEWRRATDFAEMGNSRYFRRLRRWGFAGVFRFSLDRASPFNLYNLRSNLREFRGSPTWATGIEQLRERPVVPRNSTRKPSF